MRFINSLFEAAQPVMESDIDLYGSAITKAFRRIGFKGTTYHVYNQFHGVVKVPKIGLLTLGLVGKSSKRPSVYTVRLSASNPWTSIDLDIRYTGTIVNESRIKWWVERQWPEVIQHLDAVRDIHRKASNAVNVLMGEPE